MNRYAVSTMDGRVFRIWATNRQDAINRVMRSTLGRVNVIGVTRIF